MTPKVNVRDLHKRYGAIEAVRSVTFAVAPGEIFGLLGPNGAGKTTTVECLIGLREADGGVLEVCGRDVRQEPREVKQRIGVALQSTALQDQITPREALGMFGSFYRRRASTDDLLRRFSLQEKADARFGTLSGGQRQRLALALAFVNEPEVVLLDEPTTGLDPQTRRELHGDIARMKEEGRTVLLTTHYLEEAERLCDRIAIIHRGQIVASGSPRELMAQSRGAQTVRLVTVRPLSPTLLAGLPAVDDVHGAGNEVTFHTTRANDALAVLTRQLSADGNDIVDLQVRRASLEDVFISLTQEAAA